MKVTSKSIIFETQRDRDIFQELLREVNIGEIRPEMSQEAISMLDNIIQGLCIYDEEAPS